MQEKNETQINPSAKKRDQTPLLSKKKLLEFLSEKERERIIFCRTLILEVCDCGEALEKHPTAKKEIKTLCQLAEKEKSLHLTLLCCILKNLISTSKDSMQWENLTLDLRYAEYADIALLTFLYGLIERDQQLLEKVEEWAEQMMDDLTPNFTLMTSFLYPFLEYSQDEQLLKHVILFEALGHWTGKESYLSVCEHLRAYLSPGFTSLEWYTWIEKQIVGLLETPFKEKQGLPSIQMPPIFSSKKKIERGDYRVCLNQVNFPHMGLGSAQFGRVPIVNYGVQAQPFNERSRFGFQKMTQGGKKGEITLRLHEANTSSWQWIEVTPLFHLNNWELQLRSFAEGEKFPLYFTFYIDADRALFDNGNSLYPASLEKYEGEPSSVVFEALGSSMQITSTQASSMKVIPLSGTDEFWRARFLLAYGISSETSISIK